MQANALHQAGINALHALLSVGLNLQLYRETRELSLGLLVIWLGIMFTRALWTSSQKQAGNHTTLLYGTALGLTLIQARTITQRDDEQGITQFLLIAAGLVAGASLNTKEARILLQWLGLTAITISGPLLATLFQDYSFSEGGFVAMYETVFKEGFGDQNSIRIVLPLLTASSIAAARLSQSRLMQAAMLIGAVLSYIAAVATGSRMSMVAPFVGCLLAWLIDKWSFIRHQGKGLRAWISMSVLSACSLATWQFVISPDLAGGMRSDSIRVGIFSCWLRSIFSGNNRFLMGAGHDNTPITKQCTDLAIGHPTADPLSASGHAHNTIINVIAHHGLLGLIALMVLALLYCQGLSIHRLHPHPALRPRALWTSSWNESSLIIGITLLICALSNTIYNQNQVLNLLIGLLLSLPLCRPSTTTRAQGNQPPLAPD